MINQLVKLRSLNVIRAPSVAQYAGTGRPALAEIARDLNVGTVLEATVAYADERIALNATLTEASTGRLLWSDRYDRPLEDVFGIQADIATRIAGELAAELVPAQIASLERRPTESPAAYALYLEAVSLGGRETSNDQRIELLTRAIGLDERFALAYAARAVAYGSGVVDNTTGDGASAADRPEFERLARADAVRALELDATAAGARFALSYLDALSWRWTSARAELERAGREGDPGTSLVPIYTFYLGDQAGAVRSARRSVELSPKDWLAYRNLGWVLILSHDYDDAHEALSRAIELAPQRSLPHRHMAYLQAARGNRTEALAEVRLAEDLLSGRPRLALAEIAKVYGQLGESQRARRLFDEIMSAGDPQELGAGTLATAYLAIGDNEQSLAWLRVAAEKARNHEPDQGFWSLLHLTQNITAHPTVARPEFADVLSQIRGD